MSTTEASDRPVDDVDDRVALDPVRWALIGAGLVTGAAVITVALAALAAAFTGATAPFVIGDPGPVVRWGLIVMHSVTDLAAAITVGALVLATLALPVARGSAPGPGGSALPGGDGPRAYRPAMSLVAASATVWAVGSLVLLLLTYADALGGPLGNGPDVFAQLSLYARKVPAGQGFLFTTVVTALIGLAAAGAASLRSAGLLTLAAFAALVPPALAGHAAGSGSHDTAVTAIGLHLLGVTVWLGGLLVILILAPALRTQTLPAIRESAATEEAPSAFLIATQRYSTLAGWSFAAVAGSGVVSAWLQVPTVLDLFGSRYGWLIVAKSAALLMLGGAGFWHRKVTMVRLEAGVPRAFLRLAVAEVGLMAVALGLGVALSQSAPPARGGVPVTLSVTGYPLPKAPTFERLMLGWQPDLLWLVLTGLAAVGYLLAIRRLRSRGDSWSVLRTLSFLLGLAVLVYITCGGLAVYSRVTFSSHMVAHMVLTMIVPPLLVLGAPATLALRVLVARGDGSRGPREWLLAVLHSQLLRVLSFPPVAATIFAGSLIAFYYTDLFGLSLRTHVGHELMQVHFLLAGYLFASVLIGVDPGPARPAYPLRVLLLFATMAFHAFFGIALLQGHSLLQGPFFAAVNRQWGLGLLADQQYGGGLAWGLGEAPTLLLLLALVVQWSQSDDREAKRSDRAADRDGDAELNEYNEMLAKLAERDSRHH